MLLHEHAVVHTCCTRAIYYIYVQVLTQEKAQLLKEAAHAHKVQQLYDKVKAQTHEVQLESQRVLCAVEQVVAVASIAIARKVG